MAKEKIKVEVLKRKAYHGIVMTPGQLVEVYIGPQGNASVISKPFITLRPDEYRIFIPDQEYDKLLRGELA